MDVITTLRPKKRSISDRFSSRQGKTRRQPRLGKPGFFKKLSSAFAPKPKARGAFSSVYLSASKPSYSTASSASSRKPFAWKLFRRKKHPGKKPLLSGRRGLSPFRAFKQRREADGRAWGSAASFKAKSPFGDFGGRAYSFAASDVAGYPSGISSFPIIGGFVPFLLLLSAGLCICAPALQSRFGYYFFEKKIFFDTDGAALAAMNASFSSESGFLGEGADLTSGEGEESLESDVASSVTYSNYTVRRGDTVSTIASKFGLDNMGTILSINGIQNARRLSIGQTLRIPSTDGIIYKAVSGDSAGSIASKFGVPLTAVLDANDLADSFIAVGQELFIPGATLSSYDLRKATGDLFIYPIRGRLTSRYGTRRDPFTGARSFHTGVDLAAPTGTSVKVSTDGRVVAAGWQNVYGNYVIVTHAAGYQTLYAHMHSISVKRGQYISQGDEVGKVGNTGYSTGPHLHFSVYKNGKTIDPFSILD